MVNQKKCKRATIKQIQCKFNTIPGSEFCFLHQPREIWIPFFASIILTTIISVSIGSCFSRKSFESDYISRPRNIPAIGGFPVVVYDGVGVIINQSGFVTHKMENSPFNYRISDDGAIQIYGEIRYHDGSIVAEATGDCVKVLPNSGFDINSDSKACEIVDSEGNPIYQMSVVPIKQWNKKVRADAITKAEEIHKRFIESKPDETSIKIAQERLDQVKKEGRQGISILYKGADEVIVLYYIHRIDDGWFCVTPEGSQRVGEFESMKEWQSKIPHLFRYPGKKYPGIRIDNLKSVDGE